MGAKILNLPGQVVSAPLANIAGSAYRLTALKAGAALAYSEMISVEGLVRDNHKTMSMLKLRAEERPVCFQIFGHRPEIMHDAAQIVASTGCDMVDINFGCPAKKVVKNSGGAALLKDLKLTERIISSVVSAVNIPVSVKFRSGWDRSDMAFLEVGRIAERSGAACVVLHPRTKEAGFSGRADWSKIRMLKQAVSIPVIGSGDVTSPQEAKQMLEETGCDLVMIGRAGLGAPWAINRIAAFLSSGVDPGEPSYDSQVSQFLEFARLMIEDFGEHWACLRLRKHLAWFAKGRRTAGFIREKMYSVVTYAQLEQLLAGSAEAIEKVA